MDLSSLVAGFSTGTYTITRTTKATFKRGRAQVAAATTLSIVASITPATGRDVQLLPEGRYDDETRLLFTTTKLYQGGQNEDYETDTIALDGDIWEVIHVETWIQWGGSPTVYKCMIQRP